MNGRTINIYINGKVFDVILGDQGKYSATSEPSIFDSCIYIR